MTLPLLLLPGLDGTGRLYDEFSAALPSQIDLRPLSYPADEALGYDELAERVRSELPTEPWVLIGESFSGPLALKLAAERPAGLMGLVLVATFGRRPLPIPAWLVPTLAFRVTPPRWLIRRLMFDAAASDAELQSFYDALTSVPAPTLATRARAALGADETSRMSEIDVPVLYLRAGADRLFSTSVHAAVKQHLPEMSTEVVADAPHLILQRRSREAAAAVGGWLAGLSEGASSA